MASKSNINTREYWNNEWSIRPPRYLPFYQHIVELCGDKKVLDFGCGRGDLLSLIKNGHGMDISDKSIEIIKSRKLSGEVGTEPKGKWDIIVATEVLEHLDDDKGMLKKFFEHTDTVIYSVPNNCMPPEKEPEHQRLYTREYIKKITPHFKRSWDYGDWVLVLASKNKLNLKPSVLCAVPNQGTICVDLNSALIAMSHDTRVELLIYYPDAKPIDQNRAEIVKKFLEGDWDYLLMIDDDNPPLRNPLDLLFLDKDIIACPTPQWHINDVLWLVMDKAENGEYKSVPVSKRGGLQECDAVSTGCILISRKVLEKVKAPFMRKWDKNGFALLGQDFYFCEKARELGFGVWVHWDYLCDHKKTLSLNKVVELALKNKEQWR